MQVLSLTNLTFQLYIYIYKNSNSLTVKKRLLNALPLAANSLTSLKPAENCHFRLYKTKKASPPADLLTASQLAALGFAVKPAEPGDFY